MRIEYRVNTGKKQGRHDTWLKKCSVCPPTTSPSLQNLLTRSLPSLKSTDRFLPAWLSDPRTTWPGFYVRIYHTNMRLWRGNWPEEWATGLWELHFSPFYNNIWTLWTKTVWKCPSWRVICPLGVFSPHSCGFSALAAKFKLPETNLRSQALLDKCPCPCGGGAGQQICFTPAEMEKCGNHWFLWWNPNSLSSSLVSFSVSVTLLCASSFPSLLSLFVTNHPNMKVMSEMLQSAFCEETNSPLPLDLLCRWTYKMWSVWAGWKGSGVTV